MGRDNSSVGEEKSLRDTLTGVSSQSCREQEHNNRFRKEQIAKSTRCICSFLNLV